MARRSKDNVSNKAIKYRLLPTKEQAVVICKTFGCCRFLWNEMLGLRKFYWDAEKLSLYTQPAWYKDYYPFLKDVDSTALDSVKCDLNEAFVNFYKHKTKYPKFKSRAKAKRSYRSNNVNNSIKVINDNFITLPKLGMVKFLKHKDIPKEWRIKSTTVSQDSDGKFYVSILFEFDKVIVNHKVDETKAIGLDYKSDGFYVDSNDNELGSPKYYRKKQNRLTKEQCKLSRMIGSKKGETKSSNWIKQNRKVNKIHKKVSNQRKDFCHKKAYYLAENYDIVCLEDINLKAISNSGFGNGKATCDNGFGMFRKFLEYKMADRSKVVVYVDKFFPSSQICNNCGCIHKEMKNLNFRTMVCDCGTTIDRDLNAALNIRDEGLRIYHNNKQKVV